MKCRAIRAHTGHVPVRLMCRTLAVSSSGYYAWVARPASRRTAEKRRLVAEILVIHAESLWQPPGSRDAPGPGPADRGTPCR